MTYWTILYITLIGGPFAGESFGILYRSETSCLSAHKIVSETLGYDHSLECVPTITPSNSPHPRPRPEK